MKHYVVETEHRVRDVQLSVHDIIKARSLDSARRKIMRYFGKLYAEKPEVLSDNTLFYWLAGVAVSIKTITEVNTFDDVVRELHPIA